MPAAATASGLGRGGHADDVVALVEIHAADPVGRAAHGADVGLRRSGWPGLRARPGRRSALPSVSVTATSSSPCLDADGDDAAGMTWEKSLSSVFFTVPLRVAKKMYLPSSSRLRTASMVRTVSPGCKDDQVADVFALAGGADVGNFVDLQPVDAAGVGEDEDVGVGGGDEQMLDEILVAGLHAGAARAAAALHAVGGDRRALHVAGVADGDRDLLVGDQVFEMDFGGFVFDDGAALVAVELLDLFELLDDDAAQFLLRAKNGFELGDVVAGQTSALW